MTLAAYGTLETLLDADPITNAYTGSVGVVQLRELLPLGESVWPNPTACPGVVVYVGIAGSGDADIDVEFALSHDDGVNYDVDPALQITLAGALSTTVNKRVLVRNPGVWETYLRVRGKAVTPDGTPGTFTFKARLLNFDPFTYT